MSNGYNIAADYRKRFAAVPITTTGETTLEGIPGETALSADNLKDKAEQSKEELYRIINEYLDGDNNLKKIADKIANGGKDALKAVAEDDSRFLEQNPRMQGFLEVIVRTDGSRPSFMIRNDKVDKQSSPVGVWSNIIDASGDCIQHAIKCVGRINDGGGFHVGTGYLIQTNIIVTNRHVLQAIATKENDGSWHIKGGTNIDFGHEFRGQVSVNRRDLAKVIFVAKKYIDPYSIDHSKLDLVLIELKPANAAKVPQRILSFGRAPEWAGEGAFIYTIGYPGNPGLAGLQIYSTLLEQLFKSTFGCKRLAPGMILAPAADAVNWTVTHDATTLGGNSGSLIVAVGNECTAAGLHYGGTIEAPRANWGHILGNTLTGKNNLEEITMEECLKKNKVVITDPFA